MPNPLSTKGYEFQPLSHAVIGACIDVQRQLGVHCMEVDYQRALALALPKHDLQFQREVEIPIAYDGVVVTKRRVDFVKGESNHVRKEHENKGSDLWNRFARRCRTAA